jgi:hypothetical protein
MSGWIKLEKSLENDPRVMRMARLLCRNACALEGSNASPSMAVTVVVGALARLWILADTHADCDDVLNLGAVELDELVGVEGFCGLMPSDWLEEIDDTSVKLPGFQEHNGTEAKAKAQNAKRQARHRDKGKSVKAPESNASPLRGRNAVPLPDQDQTKTIPDHIKIEEGAKRAHQLPQGFAPTGSHKELAAELHVNLDNELAQFRDHHAAKGSLMKDWDAAFRTWLRNAAKFKSATKPTRSPALAIDRSFSAVDYWKGALPDDAF